MRVSTTWNGTITALSSLAHGGETRGTITLLRREQVRLPDGSRAHVPVISGNSWRGAMRRIGEELTRDVLGYEGELSVAAAHFLRAGGGALTKSSTAPLSAAELKRLRELIPHVEVFGGASGRVFDGALQVGKMLPYVNELAHITGHPGHTSVFEATQLETYTALAEGPSTGFQAAMGDRETPLLADGSVDLDALMRLDDGPMVWRIESFPAGTQFSTWVRLERAREHAVAYFSDVLDAFSNGGRIGGRAAIGHGVFRASWEASPALPGSLPDWRTHLRENRAEAMHLLSRLA